jgi:myo-inositol 2-dehydrogenase/D-chiro-inositol 1-dehydrogenase
VIKPVRCAIIGVGRMGTVHRLACQGSDLINVTTVVDKSARVRDRLSRHGLRCYPSVGDMLGGGAIDAAVIATPTPLHQEISASLVGEGVAVLCEKPCGPTAAGLRMLAARADAGGALLRVGYWRRFVPALGSLHDQLDRGELGTVLSIETGQWDEFPPGAEYARACGGIFADMAVHDVDQIAWLTASPIRSVQAAVMRAEVCEQAGPAGSAPQAGASEQSALLLLDLANGLIAAASLGRRHPPGDVCWVRVHGTKGVRDVRFLWPPESDRQMLAAVRAQDEAFAALVLGSDEPRLATAADAAAALAVAEAAELAAATGIRVRIDESGGKGRACATTSC